MTINVLSDSNLPIAADHLAGVVILAGGASSRMGTPKATLTLPNGERLLDYHIRHAQKLGVPIMVADNGHKFLASGQDNGNNADDKAANIFAIADYQPLSSATFHNKSTRNQGALVAIMAAMQAVINKKASQPNTAHNAHWLLVISCDSLITAPDIWQKLAAYVSACHNNTAKHSTVCLSDDAHVYPLLGLYHQRLAAELQAYIDSGQRRVMPFITPHLCAVSIDPAWQALTNFNTPAAFAHAHAAITAL